MQVQFLLVRNFISKSTAEPASRILQSPPEAMLQANPTFTNTFLFLFV